MKDVEVLLGVIVSLLGVLALLFMCVIGLKWVAVGILLGLLLLAMGQGVYDLYVYMKKKKIKLWQRIVILSIFLSILPYLFLMYLIHEENRACCSK